MKLSSIVPAVIMTVCVTGASIAGRLFPSGAATLLVRTSGELPQGEAGADIRLVALPAPGLAIVHGDAGRIRATMGWAVPVGGFEACMP